MADLEYRFWETKKLDDFTNDEWEALCDGCGLCCLHRLICDDDTIATTNVVCKCFDIQNGGCKEYVRRFEVVPECIQLTLKLVKKFDWLPSTCAYRLIDAKKPLPHWHPLVCGNTHSVRTNGVNQKEHIVEHDGIILEEHILEW